MASTCITLTLHYPLFLLQMVTLLMNLRGKTKTNLSSFSILEESFPSLMEDITGEKPSWDSLCKSYKVFASRDGGAQHCPFLLSYHPRNRRADPPNSTDSRWSHMTVHLEELYLYPSTNSRFSILSLTQRKPENNEQRC